MNMKKQSNLKPQRNILIVIMMLLGIRTYSYASDYPLDSVIIVNEDSLKTSIIKNGDENSYDDLISFNYDYDDTDLDYSLIMANNYHNGRACYFVYKGIMHLYNKYNVMVDSMTYSLPFSYLEKGVSYNSKECMDELARLYSDSTQLFFDRRKASKYTMMSYEIELKETLGEYIDLLMEKGVYANARVKHCGYDKFRSIYLGTYFDEESGQRELLESDVPLNVGDTIPIIYYRDSVNYVSCPVKCMNILCPR